MTNCPPHSPVLVVEHILVHTYYTYYRIELFKDHIGAVDKFCQLPGSAPLPGNPYPWHRHYGGETSVMWVLAEGDMSTSSFSFMSPVTLDSAKCLDEVTISSSASLFLTSFFCPAIPVRISDCLSALFRRLASVFAL